MWVLAPQAAGTWRGCGALPRYGRPPKRKPNDPKPKVSKFWRVVISGICRLMCCGDSFSREAQEDFSPSVLAEGARRFAAACFIQAAFRGYVARTRFAEARAAATQIQAAWRGAVVRAHQAAQGQAATILQTYVRRWLAQRDFRRKRHAAIILQSWVRAVWRGRQVRQVLRKERAAAVCLQAFWRGRQIRKKVAQQQAAVMTTQRYPALAASDRVFQGRSVQSARIPLLELQSAQHGTIRRVNRKAQMCFSKWRQASSHARERVRNPSRELVPVASQQVGKERNAEPQDNKDCSVIAYSRLVAAAHPSAPLPDAWRKVVRPQPDMPRSAPLLVAQEQELGLVVDLTVASPLARLLAALTQSIRPLAASAGPLLLAPMLILLGQAGTSTMLFVIKLSAADNGQGPCCQASLQCTVTLGLPSRQGSRQCLPSRPSWRGTFWTALLSAPPREYSRINCVRFWVSIDTQASLQCPLIPGSAPSRQGSRQYVILSLPSGRGTLWTLLSWALLSAPPREYSHSNCVRFQMSIDTQASLQCTLIPGSAPSRQGSRQCVILSLPSGRGTLWTLLSWALLSAPPREYSHSNCVRFQMSIDTQYEHQSPSAALSCSRPHLQQVPSIPAAICSYLLPPLPGLIAEETPPPPGENHGWLTTNEPCQSMSPGVLDLLTQPGQPAFIALGPTPDAPAPEPPVFTPGPPACLSLDQLLQRESGQEADSDLEAHAESVTPSEGSPESDEDGDGDDASVCSASTSESEEDPESFSSVRFSTSPSLQRERDDEADPPPLEPWVGKVSILDLDYEGRRLLGRGAYGQAYLVEDDTGNLFAFKEIRPKLAHQHRPKFIGECNVHSLLNHENIVRFDRAVVRSVGKFRALVVGHLTEWAEGGSLLKYMIQHQDQLTLQDKLRLGINIADGLEYLHKMGFTHFDLKTENVLVHIADGGAPMAKLGDFGLAMGGFEAGKPRNIRGFLGTTIYAAPEVFIRPESVTQAADVWSLGCVLSDLAAGLFRDEYGKYHCYTLTQKLPDEEDYLRAHSTGVWRPNIPATHPDLTDIIKQCFQHNAEDRPALPAIRNALKSILDEIVG